MKSERIMFVEEKLVECRRNTGVIEKDGGMEDETTKVVRDQVHKRLFECHVGALRFLG